MGAIFSNSTKLGAEVVPGCIVVFGAFYGVVERVHNGICDIRPVVLPNLYTPTGRECWLISMVRVARRAL